jgi:hypothetical protein
MYCRNCGKETGDDVSVCPHCGASLDINAGKSGSITFSREISAFLKLIPAEIYIDGKKYGELMEKESRTVYLPYGTYSVEIGAELKPKGEAEITISADNPNPSCMFRLSARGKADWISRLPGSDGSERKNLTKILIFAIALLIVAVGAVSLFQFVKGKYGASDEYSVSFHPVSQQLGDWLIRVNDFSYSKTVLFDTLHECEAKEKYVYCIVSISVKNNGKEEKAFMPIVSANGELQALIKWDGGRYNRSELLLVDDPISSTPVAQDETITGNLIFEVPEEMQKSYEPPVLFIESDISEMTCELTRR